MANFVSSTGNRSDDHQEDVQRVSKFMLSETKEYDAVQLEPKCDTYDLE